METSDARLLFRHRLGAARRIRKLTQQQLTERLVALGEDVQRSTVGHYEQGVSVPDVTRLAKLARVLDVTVDFLLGLEDRPRRRA